jgi:hypothetical protein
MSLRAPDTTRMQATPPYSLSKIVVLAMTVSTTGSSRTAKE